MATPDLLKLKVLWNKGYDIITYVYDDTNKFLSRDSNYIVDAVPIGPSEYSNLDISFFFGFSFRTYSIDQIYLKTF